MTKDTLIRLIEETVNDGDMVAYAIITSSQVREFMSEVDNDVTEDDMYDILDLLSDVAQDDIKDNARYYVEHPEDWKG